MTAPKFAPSPRSRDRYALVALGLGAVAVGGYAELGLLALVLAAGVAASWFFLPGWYAFAVGQIGFVAGASSPALSTLLLVNAGLGCLLCGDRLRWRGDRSILARVGLGGFVLALPLWVVHRLYADPWVTAGAFGVAATCVFYLLHRYQLVEMGLTEEQRE
jgi:hypothetical protein